LKAIAYLKPVIFTAALIPAAVLAYGVYIAAVNGDTRYVGADPLAYITNQTGWWALSFLMMALAVTPIRRLTGWNAVIRLRRMLGLFSFFYALLHMLTWLVLLNYFDLDAMVKDVIKRPYITVGMATFLILSALAITSNRFAVRRLGKKWQTLHRLVYAAGIGAVIHFWWLVKADITEPRRWAVLLAVLLAFRVWWVVQKRGAKARPAAA
jgi:methionine sulfoxide reductase heme-binding subunit